MPSEWYETFGLTIIEAYACGTPVIASDLGTRKDLVVDGVTGYLFEPGNAMELRNLIIEKTKNYPSHISQSPFLCRYSHRMGWMPL